MKGEVDLGYEHSLKTDETLQGVLTILSARNLKAALIPYPVNSVIIYLIILVSHRQHISFTIFR